jgi:hypothetical protein
METERNREAWQELSDAILTGMSAWRKQNPKATLTDLERELGRRIAGLEAQMLADLAMTSSSQDWDPGGPAPQCPTCGVALVPKGSQSRKLQTREGHTLQIEREYGICPECGQGFFPPG